MVRTSWSMKTLSEAVESEFQNETISVTRVVQPFHGFFRTVSIYFYIIFRIMNIPAFYGSESGHSDLVNMLYQSRSGHPAEHLLQGALDPHKLQRT